MALGDLFKLPLVDTAQKAGAGAVSYVIAGVTTKLTEAATAAGNLFGTTAPFQKLGAQTATFKEMQATAQRELASNSASGVQSSQLLKSFGGETEGSNVSAASLNQIQGPVEQAESHQVKLVDKGTGYRLIFWVMPEIVENHNVEYEAVAPPQFPGAFQKYKGTSPTTYTINATFICRTQGEAQQRFEELNLLKSWKMPYFGANTARDHPTKLGAPPAVLTLSGFRDRLIGPVPVVITSLSWNWPRDVDYLPTLTAGSDGKPVPFPAVMTIAISLVESFSTQEFNQFDLTSYRHGDMVGAYKTPTGESGSAKPSSMQTPSAGADTSEIRSAGAGRGYINPDNVQPLDEIK